MISFRDWLNAQESSAFTRSRRAAALGLGPSIPDAAINSRSTARPWESEFIQKRNKKKKKKKCSDKKDESFYIERKNNKRPINTDVDRWLASADSLKRELEKLKDALDKKAKSKLSEKEPQQKIFDKVKQKDLKNKKPFEPEEKEKPEEDEEPEEDGQED